ncbi:DUF2845 domain-containing protein [Pyxidicoccus fallax]|uniref:DUF2845 domain-containing protein n=1 Tax=Pyxidicoccus fallax TaxID=394095 RepID=A0A848LDI0_9BACT|nr:DUF2845 domain-containing protein [Pyxidicoccus fallax]NPC78851.1 DUF2845 domain-containing protein [Pyxidicoccus fallax]
MRSLMLAVAVALMWVPGAVQAASLRCGSALVSDGASKSDVIAKCGEPIAKESRSESEETKMRDGDTSTKRVVQKTFEEWTYNFGPNRLMQVVVFENGKLIDVKSGGYGR